MDDKGTLYGVMSGRISLDGDVEGGHALQGAIVPPEPLSGSVANDPKMAKNDYDALVNRPQINGITLTGNKLSRDLGIDEVDFATLADIDSIFLEEG